MSKFILITVNDDYDEATHSFAKEYDVAINPDQISSIEDLTIDDPEYKNKRGSTISMADGRVYTAEAYSIEELLRIIDGKNDDISDIEEYAEATGESLGKSIMNSIFGFGET